MIKEKKYTEEEALSMNGWDTFVDQYLTEKRNLDKQKCGLPFMSKPNLNMQTMVEKK
jgi:hypothetical protein